MGTFVSTCLPCDATGRVVNLDTEYMYRDDGLKLKVIRFEYYKSDNADYNWFILTPIDSSNAIKVDRYKVADLYVDSPTNANIKSAIQDLDKLKNKITKLKFNLVYGCISDNLLLDQLTQVYADLINIIQKLENQDAE